jgi:hypothetical protein
VGDIFSNQKMVTYIKPPAGPAALIHKKLEYYFRIAIVGV